jgi:MinD-like ATPase involved in chromosome partitioning or flagellar assembly
MPVTAFATTDEQSAGEHPADVPVSRTSGPSFDALGGPAVAICALCGGAGASTLAYTLAAATAQRSTQPVFACETSGITGGLALYARAQPRLSLTEAANQVAAGTPPSGLVVSSPERVRVLGSRPALAERCDPDGAERILSEARAAGGLLVLDCGTADHDVDRVALLASSHVLWVIPATASGVARGEHALELLAEFARGRQALVARLERNEHVTAVSRLADLAARWELELILFPHVEDVAQALVEEAIDAAQVALEAIAAVLGR